MTALALLLALGGCGSSQSPSGGTPDDEQSLNDAAAMLDNNSVAADTLTPTAGNRP